MCRLLLASYSLYYRHTYAIWISKRDAASLTAHIVTTHIHCRLYMCAGGLGQWQWELPPVASLTVSQCVCPHLCPVTEQKATRSSLWSNESLQCMNLPVNYSRETLMSTYTTPEINIFTPPHCSLLLSLPRLMRDLLLLAEGLLLTPSRSQMIVCAAWGPDPTSPDPVTGTMEHFYWEFNIKRGKKIELHPEHRECASC